jgi:hypothetical protein
MPNACRYISTADSTKKQKEACLYVVSPNRNEANKGVQSVSDAVPALLSI